MARDRQPVPSLIADETRWKTVVFDYPDTITSMPCHRHRSQQKRLFQVKGTEGYDFSIP